MGKISDVRGSVVTVGTFDGVHRGHREVLKLLTDRGRRSGLRPLVVTFDRHPLATLFPERAPRMLQTGEERDAIIHEAGAEVVEVAFTRELSSLTAREWIEILRDRYHAVELITGYDNTFGRDGKSLKPEDFVKLGEETGIKVITAGELPGVCSSAIRAAVARGDMEDATRMLGRRYKIRGVVERGRQLGRQLGFPTANVAPYENIQLPAVGVYAGYLNGRPAVVNVGTNPTITSCNPVTVEAHVLGFDKDIYGEEVELEFVCKLREEKKFDSLEALRQQIELDAQKALRITEDEKDRNIE